MSRSEEGDVPATVEECIQKVRISSSKGTDKGSVSNLQEGCGPSYLDDNKLISRVPNSCGKNEEEYFSKARRDTSHEADKTPKKYVLTSHLDNILSSQESCGTYTLHKQARECLEPFEYICTLPGKNVRSQLIDGFQSWLQIPLEKVEQIKEIVGYLHNASLLVDDIEDNSRLRRGKPVAHSIYGIPNTLNCGNYVYFLAMEKCRQLHSSEAIDVMLAELLNLHRGQGRELVWRENLVCPSLKEYISMILDKTGGLFRLAIRLMMCFSPEFQSLDGQDIAGWKSSLGNLVNLLSIYFQIRDDYINLANTKYHMKKSFCEDITEGKFSFPIIHCIQASRSSEQNDSKLMSILRQRTEDRELKLCAVGIMRDETESFKYTKEYLGEVRDKIYAEIENLGGHEHLRALMQLLER